MVKNETSEKFRNIDDRIEQKVRLIPGFMYISFGIELNCERVSRNIITLEAIGNNIICDQQLEQVEKQKRDIGAYNKIK